MDDKLMRVTVLGSCGTFPTAGRACSGFLVEGSDGDRHARVWVDTGSGTFSNLLRHTTLAALDAIWVSHLHMDHVSDLPAVNYALRFGRDDRRPSRLPVFGPHGWADHLRAFLTLDSVEPTERGRDTLDEAFEVHELHDGQRVDLGPLRLTAMATLHGVETYGVRAAVGDQVVAYSADSGPCPALEALAADARLFICEAAWLDWDENAPPMHLTPQLAGEYAARAGAQRLTLTHLRNLRDPQVAAMRAKAAFGGEVSLAREGDVFELGGPGGTL
jgi:ribonuclease BN (tRNA processing enzyme)